MFEHYVITRFNLGLYKNESIDNKTLYMDYRIKIFRDIYIKSFLNQTCEKFKIIVMIDHLTPDYYKEEILNCYKEKIFVVPMIANNFDDIFKTADLKNKILLECKKDYLITTRVDNDDGVSNNFIEIIQSNFNKQQFEFLNFSNGYILNLKKNKKIGFYKSKQLSNPFITLIENFNNNFKTVMCDWHTRLNKYGKIVQNNSDYMWLQTIHENNISNIVSSTDFENDLNKIKNRFNINWGLL